MTRPDQTRTKYYLADLILELAFLFLTLMKGWGGGVKPMFKNLVVNFVRILRPFGNIKRLFKARKVSS